jgi:ATP-dependent Clp protease adaptor protein ClpS
MADPPSPQPRSEDDAALYSVMLLNDDHTPMEFVVDVLERFFDRERAEAIRVMLHIHNQGIGVCGVYPELEAHAKVAVVLAFAQQHQHPLQCVMERAAGAPGGVVRI